MPTTSDSRVAIVERAADGSVSASSGQLWASIRSTFAVCGPSDNTSRLCFDTWTDALCVATAVFTGFERQSSCHSFLNRAETSVR